MYEIKGLKEFERAIHRNPRIIKDETKIFFTKAIAEFRRVVTRSPWRVGGNGGGVPVDTGNLRTAHTSKIGVTEASYGIHNIRRADYAWAVHEGTGRMKERPWLDYAVQNKKQSVYKLADEMLKKVVINLAK